MDIWEVICMLTRTVYEQQNCFLEIMVTESGIDIQLMPMGDDVEGEWDE